MRFYFILLLVLIGLFPAEGQAKGPIVLELFTTQSCSTCPPADRVFNHVLERDEDVIGVACHIPFMNFAWEDTFSQDFCTDRMTTYFGNLGVVSMRTPTLVLNGKYEMMGMTDEIVDSALAMARVEEEVLPLSLRIDKGVLSFDMPGHMLNNKGAVWLYGYNVQDEVDITAGDNEGLSMIYRNYATSFKKLMDWHGEPLSVRVELEPSEADYYVVLVQGDADEGILAAGKVSRLPQSFSKP